LLQLSGQVRMLWKSSCPTLGLCPR
jgi:hypothetical protein